MKAPFFLIVNAKGSVRVCKTRPALSWDEISIQMHLELPDSLFKKPLLTADIKVKESDVTPTVITPDVQNNIEAAIKQHSGVQVKLTLVTEEKKR